MQCAFKYALNIKIQHKISEKRSRLWHGSLRYLMEKKFVFKVTPKQQSANLLTDQIYLSCFCEKILLEYMHAY